MTKGEYASMLFLDKAVGWIGLECGERRVYARNNAPLKKGRMDANSGRTPGRTDLLIGETRAAANQAAV
jgi:hypothetical protein